MNGQTIALGKTAKTKTKTKSKIKTNQFDIVKFLNDEKVKKVLIKVSVALIVLGLLMLGYLYFTHAYSNKIYPKVSIAGIKVDGLTESQTKQLLDAKVQTLNVNGPEITYNDQTVNPKLDELGLIFDTQKMVNEAFNFGRQGSLKQKLSENYQLIRSGYQMEITPQFDENKFDSYLSQLAAVIEKEPVNASLKIQNGQIVVTPPQNGRGLDKSKLKEDLTALINSGSTNGKIATYTTDFQPEIMLEGTNEAKAQAEKYLAAQPITVTFENSAWTADRAEIGSWIKFTPSGDKLAASADPNSFVNWIASQVDIPTIDREIQDGIGAVLNEGQDGRGTDTVTLKAQINDALSKGQSGTFALGTFAIPRGEKIIYPHAQPGRYAGHYIDINLSEQTLYAFDGSILMNQFLISSGKRGYETPTGEFNVYSKSRSNLMSGPDYYLPDVPWISRFAPGPISVHGTYWHSNFGTPMSHGCINASIPDAEWVYNFVDIGTPVYVHY